MTGIHDVEAHFIGGDLQRAVLGARELLASDAAHDAASLLLRIRIDQGWFADAIRLARERFLTALPSNRLDGVATLRLHLARLFAGAHTADALRAMSAVAASANSAGDLWLQAFAAESIAKATVAALQLSGRRDDVASFDDLFIHAASLYDFVGDRHSALAVQLQLASLPGAGHREGTLGLLANIADQTATEGMEMLALKARLRLAAVNGADPGALLVDCRKPLARARVLRQKFVFSAEQGSFDESTAAEALDLFRREDGWLDVVGFTSEVAEKAFALGHFIVAAGAARESLAAADVMPFPYGEANARLMLAASLHHQGRFLEAASQYQQILSLPPQYRHRFHLDVLPSIGFLLQVRQAERARQLAFEYVAEIESAPPSQELSIALHYLANANVDLRRWPDVFDALERSAAVDDALGNQLGAAMKRIELSSWRIKAHWLKGEPLPAGLIESAMKLFDEEERRLATNSGHDADGLRMSIHQARTMALQVTGAAAAALESLARFGDFATRLGSQVHITNYHTQAGLILHDLGRQGNAQAAVEAQRHFDEALARVSRTEAPDSIANAAYLAAANERVLARFAATDDAISEHLSRALALLQDTDRHIAQLQMRYAEPGSEAAQLSRIAIHGPWKKVYDIAVELLLVDAGEAGEAYSWVEKWKGRALAVTLGLGAIPTPADIPGALLDDERGAIRRIHDADHFDALTDARDRLQAVWDRMSGVPEAGEYLSLRTGQPVTFEELASLLAAEERSIRQIQSPTRINDAQNDGSSG